MNHSSVKLQAVVVKNMTNQSDMKYSSVNTQVVVIENMTKLNDMNHSSDLIFDCWCLTPLSWPLVYVVEEVGVPGENHRSWASNW
jgi:hypothetical protein